jgi:UDP:flavonoid glycosyltransferase YjiC (YdhE family)
MRVLFVSTPGIGHLFPLVPLATALRAAGHEVLVVTASTGEVMANAGLHVVDVAPDLDVRRIFEQAAANADPELFERMRSDEPIRDLNVVASVFAGVNRPLIDGTVHLAQNWRPDLIVHSQMAAAGVLAAAKIDVPAIQLNFGFARTGDLQQVIAGYLADCYEQHGISDLPTRMTKLDVAPPSMIDGEPEGWPARFVPYNGGGVLPNWLLDKPQRPRIAVTLGTVSTMMNGLGPVHRILEYGTKLDVELVLALGDTDLRELGELPDNARSAGWVPLGALLWNCAAVVHHGGSGTTLTALDAGIPQLVLPDGADRFFNADAVHLRGVGIAVSGDDVDDSLLGQLISDEKLRTAAAEVREEMATMPSPAALVPRLVELANTAD